MSILDRYIAAEFWKGLLAAMATFLVLYLGGDTLRQGLREDVPAAYAMQFTLYSLPDILVLLLPAACLMGTLISLSGFARRNELTAMFASGVSLGRISFVIMSLVFMLCCISFVVTDRVIPPMAKMRSHFLRTVIQGKPDLQTDIKQNKIWYRSRNLIYNLRSFNPRKNEISGLSIYTFDDNFDLVQQIEASRANYVDGKWVLADGLLTLFEDDTGYPVTKHFDRQTMSLSESPGDFKEIEKEVETLRLKNLWKYIQRNKSAGIDTRTYEVVFWSKTSMALVPLIMALLGIPFASKHHRHASVARDISLCFFIVVAYWLMFSAALSMGKTGWIPPFWAAWTPNFLFFAFGLFMVLRTRRA
ncbi:MAG TPA: LPS export ABC transporter permease LptG [Bdellovibrionota bacterium]